MTDIAGSNASAPPERLAKNSIGLAHIVFFVIAAAAPMTAVVGATPPAFAFGNGSGVPGAFIVAGCLYLLFSVGFTAMSRHVVGAGAFYAYISRGLGRAAGIGGALMALLAYFSVQIAIFALFSVFMAGAMASLGIDAPWSVWSAAILVVVVLCGRRNIAVSGRILGACMLAELAIILVLNVAIVANGGGPEGFSLSGFMPSEVFVPGLGVALVFVVGSYIGFEATAIFSEEAHRPERTIPRATYTAVILITLFYAFSTWAIVQHYGPGNVQQAALNGLDTFYFDAARTLLGAWAVHVMEILLLVSLFACLLSLHNTLNRYFYALTREGLLWKPLAAVHPRHRSPHVAGLVQAGLVLAVLLAFALAGTPPYEVVFAWMSAMAVLAILATQTLVSVAVVAFFRRDGHGRSPFVRIAAPVLSAVGLAGAFLLVAANSQMLTGSDSILVRSFPAIVLAVGVGGLLVSFGLKHLRPERYARLGRAFD